MLSFVENIPYILQAVRESGAKKILDVGGGMGKYSLLIREQYLSSKAEAGELSPKDDLIIDCCEDTKYFIEMTHHDGMYDKHYHQSVFDKPFKDNYDLYLFIDTVEHWDKDKTVELLSSLGGKKLISTPKHTVMYQEHFYGDPRHHQTQWSADDFQGKDYSSPQSHIFVI